MSQTHSLDRIGAAACLAHVVLFLAIINLTPAILVPDRPISEIATATAAHSSGILWSAYLSTLVVLALFLFGAALASRLARHDAGDWAWLALVGTAALAVSLGDDDLVRFVRAVGHGVRGDALWTTYPSGPDGVVMAIPMAVLLLAVCVGGRRGALPRWLCTAAGLLAATFVLGGAGITGDEVDGGLFGTFLVLGFLGFWIWTVLASVHLLRHAQPTTAPSGSSRSTSIEPAGS
jgi:hypothetical protein